MGLSIDLKGKTVMVTGVSSGIGRGVATMLSKAGAIVSGCDIKKENSEEVTSLKEEIEKNESEFIYTEADVTSEKDLNNFITKTINVTGKIDVLISNAGLNMFYGSLNCSDEEWDDNINLNLKSHWMISKLCHKHLSKSDDGVIIIMASNHAIASMPGCFPYNVAKTALTGLVKSLAIEWGPSIRTIGLAPGFIDTKGNDLWFDTYEDPIQARKDTIKKHPVAKLGTPEDIGAFCCFLASPLSTFSSGTTYVIDGGRSALLQDE